MCQEFDKGAFALLDISSPDFAPMLKSFAGVSGIPYISMLDESFYSATLDNNMHFIAEPPGTEMLTIIAEIVRMENMTNIAIIYDDAFG